MKATSYAGINYAGSTGANQDKATGIRYGVIAQNSLSPEAVDEVFMNQRDLSFEAGIKEAKDALKSAVEDYVRDSRLADIVESLWAEVEQEFSDSYQSDGDHDWLWEGDGYVLSNCLQSDIFVSKSPFFTYAQFCSPCVPGACNLDSPLADAVEGNKCFCIGHDWFDDSKAPYPVFSVETGLPVEPSK